MTENQFKSNLINWLCANHMPNIDIDFDYDFGYLVDDDFGIHIINIGVEANDEVGSYFEQFLYEYGCEYCGIPYPILCMLHECGHIMTLNRFSETELGLFQFAKQFDHGETDQEWLNKYWMVPDEFAANMWVVNFINNHIEEVEDLCNTFIHGWIALHETVDSMFDLIKE